MNYQQLRQKYPKFIYEKFEYEELNGNLEIKFHYSIPRAAGIASGDAWPDHRFTHKIVIRNSKLEIRNLENLIFHVGLSLMPSYWKSTCSPIIEIQAGHLTASQISFWEKLFLKGMGEYFYKNQIDFTPKDFLKIISIGKLFENRKLKIENSGRILVPVGGGKDSVVTLELLKPHYKVVPFIVNPVPIILRICEVAGLKPLTVTSELDPYLLELNRQGYLNGHVPLSAFYAFAACFACQLLDIPAVAFSNERSSDEGNTEYLGHTINHQYSKSLEFESDLNNYLIRNLKLEIRNFSFLRSLYELQITKLFSRYPQYFPVFSSCNQNFKLDKKWPATRSSKSEVWCGKCPKCVSTALMLACFIGKQKVKEIMGSYPPDLPENKTVLDDLLGKNPVKPFECVLTRAEAGAAYNAVELGQLDQLGRLLSSWMDNPNMPPEFSQILKDVV